MQPETSSEENITENMRFGRYVPLKLIGKGAMGRVYLSLDPVLQRSVAVKVISLDDKIDSENHKSFVDRFTLEARASAQLNHQSIVTVFDAGEQNGFPWIAFEFVDGESLEDLLKREQLIDIQRVRSILFDIGSALKIAHNAKIVHRDVKPANILIEKKSGIAKLSDFGVIKAPFSMVTQEGMTLGSPGYMSPEQIDGTGVDCRSDLFSLGIIYYQMVTGVHPFIRETLQQTLYATLMGEYTSIRKLRNDIDSETEKLVAKMLKVSRDDRVGSAEEFLELLAKCTAGSQGIFKPGPVFIKTIQPVINIIRKTDDVITSTAQNKVVRNVLDKSTTTAKKAFTAVFVVLKSVPVRRIAYSKRVQRLAGVLTFVVLVLSGGYYLYDNYFSLSKDETGVLRELAVKDGHKGTPSQLIKKCRSLIEMNELNDAQEIAEALSRIKRYTAHAHVLNSIIELKDKDGDDAVDEIDEGKKARGFRASFRKENELYKEALREYLTNEEIDREMVDCIVYSLHLGHKKYFRVWAYDKAYWLRWNSVNILQEVGLKVDMANVYILDLKYANSMRVRIRAANKLAEIKDKRAISALEEVARRGFSDPIVSVAAQSALDEIRK
jgi:tRNA A-37 threonylcarbamoyl transferase component Bud32